MNSPYHLIAIATIIFLSYALTWLLSYFSVLSKIFHRRFWNTVLLIVFLTTAIIGILLTLQVNFKFELPTLDTYMVWHVDAGIAFVIVSIFHIYWHWKYYLALFKATPTNNIQQFENYSTNIKTTKNYTLKGTILFAILLGIDTLIIQTLLLREFMVMFQGNELTIGIIMFFWMFFTGLGALFSTKKNLNNLQLDFSLLLLIIITAFLIVVSNYFRFRFFLPGKEVGLFHVVWFSALFLIPICFFSGFLFPQLVNQYNIITNKNKANIIYSVETLGSVFGGLLFTFILGRYFRSLEILSFLLLVNSMILVLVRNVEKTKKLIIIGFSILILLATTLFNVDETVKQALYLNQLLISYQSSPYGDISVTEQYEQLNYFQNTDLLYNNQDIIKVEESVHFPMLQHENPKNILVFSGNYSAIINELSKYKVSKIDFIETNPILFKKWKLPDSLSFSENNVSLIKNDLREYLEKSDKKYDIAILNLPSTVSLQANRFYTDEFYKLLKKQLANDGIICFNLPPVYNYLNNKQIKLLSSIHSTIKQHFKHVEFFVGEGTYLVASKKNINLNVGELADNKNLINEYVNSYYIDSWSMNQRNEEIKQQLIPGEQINYDFKPVAFQLSIINWLEKNQNMVGFWIVLGLLLLTFVVVFLFHGRSRSALFLAGFSTSAVEIVLIYIFQIMHGNIYQHIGLIIALFMLGITIGASDIFEKLLTLNNKNYRKVQFLLILMPLLTVAGLSLFAPGNILFLVILIFALVVPLCTGWLFHFASQTQNIATIKLAGSNYFVDLLGSAIGVFLVSIFVLPHYGLYVTLLIISAVNLIGLIRNS